MKYARAPGEKPSQPLLVKSPETGRVVTAYSPAQTLGALLTCHTGRTS